MTTATAQAYTSMEKDVAPAQPSRAASGTQRTWRLSKRSILGLVATAAVLSGGGWYARSQGHESTDDAQVDAEVVAVLSAVIGVVLYGSLFAIPIFAGSILQYTPQQVGLLLLPAAITSAVGMPLVAKLVVRFDPRALLGVGSLTWLASIWMFSQLSPRTGGDDLFWPNVVRGLATVMMFLPLQLTALGAIPKAEVAAASGFFNLTRQLGGSIGVALLTTFLDKRMAFHRAVLVEGVTAGDPRTVERVDAFTSGLAVRGVSLEDAQHKALALLDGAVNLQSAVMSFADTFLATGALLVTSVPLILLLRRPAAAGGPSMGH